MIVFLAVALIAVFFIYRFWPKPTCTDGKQNQSEEGVDCGGPCTPCIKEPRDITVLWSRVFPLTDGVYEAAGLIENPNLSYGLPLLKYRFKLYEEYEGKYLLVKVKEGKTFVNPQDKFLIYEPSIKTGERTPTRVFLEIEPLSDWRYLQARKHSLVITSKKFINSPFASLEASLFNESLDTQKEIYASAVLYDEAGSVLAVSSTKIDKIGPRATKVITFTWPVPFKKKPASSEIFVRINQF
jgi:hypothetical protein